MHGQELVLGLRRALGVGACFALAQQQPSAFGKQRFSLAIHPFAFQSAPNSFRDIESHHRDSVDRAIGRSKGLIDEIEIDVLRFSAWGPRKLDQELIAHEPLAGRIHTMQDAINGLTFRPVNGNVHRFRIL